MARVNGSIRVTSSYEVSVSKPMDARTLVPSYADLTNNDNWINDKGNPCCYNGMIVAVANISDTTYNGLYMLLDSNNSRRPDVTTASNWIKIGETSDTSELITRIESIEQSILDIAQDVRDLDSRVSDLEKDEKLHTYGYRTGFPTVGEAGHMYVAIDEKKTYVWYNDEYTAVGGSDYEEPTVIYGGDSGID